MESLTQFRPKPKTLEELLAPPPPGFAPMAVPGASVISPPVHNYPSDGPTVLAQAYGWATALDAAVQAAQGVADASVIRAGDTMTGTLSIDTTSAKLLLKKSGSTVVTFDANGALDVNLPSDLGVIAQFRHAGITDAFFSSSGNQHLRGNMGIGPFADTPPYRLWVREPTVETFFTETIDPQGSGGTGWFINKPDRNLTTVHSIIFQVEGISHWGVGCDFDTAATGNSDFISCYDHASGWDDSGARTFAGGADIMRFTPANESNTGKCTQWDLSGQGANRNTTPYWGILGAGINLSGVNLSIHGGTLPTSRNHLLLTQRALTHKRAAVDFNLRWLMAQDINADNTPNFTLFDQGSTAANKARFVLVGDNAQSAKLGIGTPNVPLACLHAHLQAGSAGNTVIETPFAAGYSQDLANRMVNIQQTSDGTTVRNFVLLSGQVAGTAAAPTLTSTGAMSAGLERTDTALSVVVAAGGAAQAIQRPLTFSAAGGIGAYGAVPTTRQTATAAATDLASVIALANSLRSGLIAQGWFA